MHFTLPETPRSVLTWLTLVVIVFYFNALSGDFQFDDYKVIVDNPGVHSWDAWRDRLGHGIRPLLNFSYTLNWTSGLGVAGFHLTNLLIHLCNVCLVYKLTGEFVRAHSLRDHLNNVPLFTALLFAAHPIHTEAVTYVSGRSISLMTLFYLAGMLTYITGDVQQNKIKLHVLVPFLFVIALSVKETAVTFPFALLTWERCCDKKFSISFKQQWTSWTVLLLGTLFFLFNNSYLSQMERSAGVNNLQGNIATQSIAFVYLLRQWFFPFWLNIDPDLHGISDFSGSLPQLFLLGSIFILMWHTWRLRPWIGFGLAWALIQLLPLYILLPRLDIANDRQMYLVSWPLAMACVAELSVRLKPQSFESAGVVLILVLGGLTSLRNHDYQTEILLWENTVIQSPNKARTHNNLGYAYMLAGRNLDARREFTTALKIEPEHIKAQYNLLRLKSKAAQLP